MGARAGELWGLRNLLAVTCVAALVLCSSAKAAAPTPVVDQSYYGRVSLSAAINDCCNYVAQTFTAGRDGLLAGVNIDTEVAQAPDVPLRVSIRNFEGGVPGETVLATTLLPSAFAPFSQLVTFPQTVEIRAGVKYSIVVNLEDPLPLSQGNWAGGDANPYPAGCQGGMCDSLREKRDRPRESSPRGGNRGTAESCSASGCRSGRHWPPPQAEHCRTQPLRCAIEP